MNAGDVGLNSPYVALDYFAPVSGFMMFAQWKANEVAYYVSSPFSLFWKYSYASFIFHFGYFVGYLPGFERISD